MTLKPHLLLRYWLTALITLGLVLSATSCVSKISSQPYPESNLSTTPFQNVVTPTSQNTEPLSYKNVSPCDLLSTVEAEEIMGELRKKPNPERVGTSRTCQFSPKDGSLGIGVRANAGISELNPNGGKIIDISVNNRKARQLQDNSDTCGIALDGGPSARAEVTFYHSEREQACPMALKVATAVEKNLTKLGL